MSIVRRIVEGLLKLCSRPYEVLARGRYQTRGSLFMCATSYAVQASADTS